MALHLTANEFFLLLAGTPSTSSNSTDTTPSVADTSIEGVLASKNGAESMEEGVSIDRMALAMESKLSTTEKWGRLAWAGAKVEFDRDQDKLVVRLPPFIFEIFWNWSLISLNRVVTHSPERNWAIERPSCRQSRTRPMTPLEFSRIVNLTE